MFSSLEKLNWSLIEEADDSMKNSAVLLSSILKNLVEYCFVLHHHLVLVAHFHGK